MGRAFPAVAVIVAALVIAPRPASADAPATRPPDPSPTPALTTSAPNAPTPALTTSAHRASTPALTTSAIVTPPAPPLVPRAPAAQLVWAWPRFHTAEYVATALIGAAVIPTLAIKTSSSPWRAPNGFDEGARDALLLRSDQNRWIARDTSDFLLTLAVSYPVLVDAIGVAWWGRRSPDVAYQMAAIDLEAFAVNGVLSALISAVTSRERPYGRLCDGDPDDQTRDCSGSKRYRSFFSGHTSTAFTSAGLICIHHAHLPLYRGVADPLACATAMLAAASVGVLRVASDQHYLSDVLVGAAAGAAVGLGVPWLLHYRVGSMPRPDKRDHVSLSILPAPLGGYVVGTF